jgi:hypothetical protein
MVIVAILVKMDFGLNVPIPHHTWARRRLLFFFQLILFLVFSFPLYSRCGEDAIPFPVRDFCGRSKPWTYADVADAAEAAIRRLPPNPDKVF